MALQKEKYFLIVFAKPQAKYIISFSFLEYGLTLADGSVLISIPVDDDLENGACCLMTIFHEITHVLFRKIINTNSFRRSFDETQDEGNKVEQLLVGELNLCYKEGCDFILDLNNSQLSVTLFNKAFHEIEERKI